MNIFSAEGYSDGKTWRGSWCCFPGFRLGGGTPYAASLSVANYREQDKDSLVVSAAGPAGKQDECRQFADRSRSGSALTAKAR